MLEVFSRQVMGHWTPERSRWSSSSQRTRPALLSRPVTSLLCVMRSGLMLGWLDYPAGEFILNQDMLRVACWASSEPLEETQMRTVCVCVCLLYSCKTTAPVGGEILCVREQIRGKTLWGDSLSRRRHALVLQMSTNKFSRLHMSHIERGGHQMLAQTWRQ